MNEATANKKITLVINNIKVKHVDELMQYLEMLKKNEKD